ncbi:MAG: hypothetical protein H7230_03480 [Candidatus Parcubacteria bacterium]|nr:hypothetical protein [Candidatus Paceibacterota bacterium]
MKYFIPLIGRNVVSAEIDNIQISYADFAAAIKDQYFDFRRLSLYTNLDSADLEIGTQPRSLIYPEQKTATPEVEGEDGNLEVGFTRTFEFVKHGEQNADSQLGFQDSN